MHSSVFILIFGEDCLKFIELEVSHKPKTNSRDVSSVVTGTVLNLLELIHAVLSWMTNILLDVLLCSIAEYFYELCRILTSHTNNE